MQSAASGKWENTIHHSTQEIDHKLKLTKLKINIYSLCCSVFTNYMGGVHGGILQHEEQPYSSYIGNTNYSNVERVSVQKRLSCHSSNNIMRVVCSTPCTLVLLVYHSLKRCNLILISRDYVGHVHNCQPYSILGVKILELIFWFKLEFIMVRIP